MKELLQGLFGFSHVMYDNDTRYDGQRNTWSFKRHWDVPTSAFGHSSPTGAESYSRQTPLPLRGGAKRSEGWGLPCVIRIDTANFGARRVQRRALFYAEPKPQVAFGFLNPLQRYDNIPMSKNILLRLFAFFMTALAKCPQKSQKAKKAWLKVGQGGCAIIYILRITFVNYNI